MKPRPGFLLLPALVLTLCCGPGGTQGEGGGSGREAASSRGPEETGIRLQDAAGRQLTLSGPPTRIISLVPSASEFIQALGAGSLLVGRTDFDTAPELAHLPSVGGGLNPSLEALVALEPDLVIRFAGDSDPKTPLRMDELGIPHLAIRPDGVQDILGIIRTLGVVTGREAAADSLRAHVDATLEEIRSRIRGRVPVRVAYLLGGTPPWVAGPGSYIGELLELAGGVNVFSDLSALYGPVSVEAFLVREMDLILAPEGTEVELPAGGLRVTRVPTSVEIPGPGLAESAWTLARILHPEAFR